MKFGLSNKVGKIMKKLFASFPEVDEVIIFGSRTMGNYKKSSDVDIALKGKEINLDIHAKIKYELDEILPLPYFFDVVNYEDIESPELIEHIDEFGVLFYKKDN